MTDFQIIGGGLIGLCTAYALMQRGAKNVRVIESRSGVGLETSFANAGMVHASLANPWNGPGVGGQILKSFFDPHSAMKVRAMALPSLIGWGGKFLRHSLKDPHWQATCLNYALAQYSVDLNREWRGELSIDDDKDGDGLLKIYRNTSEFVGAKTMADKLADLGLETEYLDRGAACVKEPALQPIIDDIAGAIYYPTEFKANAYKFCQALAAEIIARGGEILTDTHVQGFERRGGVVDVLTNTGKYTAGMTIVCAGAHSYHLLKPIGLKLTLRPVKGYSLSLNKADLLKDALTPKIPIVDDSLHTAITPFSKFLRIAGTAELAGFNRSMPPSRLQPLLDMFKQIYPQLAGDVSLKDCQRWYGFRPVSADGVPFIGRTKIAGLAVNTGHAHMGWTMCAGSGVLLADILLGQSTALVPDGYSPCR